MVAILSIKSTEALDVDPGGDVVVDGKVYSWTARIVADCPCNVKVGVDAQATEDDFVITEFEPVYLLVPAGADVSVLGTEAGTAWVTEVKFAAV